MGKVTYDSFYKNAEIKLYKTDDASIAVRIYGGGPSLFLVHGFPVHGYTWRKILPKLSEHFTCYVVDLPGLGDSEWTAKTDFTFTRQARRLSRLFEMLEINECSILAQDTGATISRLVAASEQKKIKKMVIINTEIPNHRPPWIPLYRNLARLPGANTIFRCIFASPVVRTSMGLKGFYFSPSLLNEPGSLAPYVKPLTRSAKKMDGMLAYLKGIEWDVVDDLVFTHKVILAETMIIWGENDKIFPVELAKKMSGQFGVNSQFIGISEAGLMPHEEKPDEILEHTIPFLLGG